MRPEHVIIIIERRVYATIHVPGVFAEWRGDVANVRLLANRGEYDDVLADRGEVVYETRYVCTVTNPEAVSDGPG